MTVLKSNDTHFSRCCDEILRVQRTMIETGEMKWTRSQFLQSDEAARDVIARLPEEFRSIDCNFYRRCTNSIDKLSADKGGFARWDGKQSPTKQTSLINALSKWDQSRDRNHSEEYDTDTEERRNKRSDWKRMAGYRCAACGDVRTGVDLEIHHYTYERFGCELDEDVCCVCNPQTTGMPCHPLLDFARELRQHSTNDDANQIRDLFARYGSRSF